MRKSHAVVCRFFLARPVRNLGIGPGVTGIEQPVTESRLSPRCAIGEKLYGECDGSCPAAHETGNGG